MNSIKKLKRYLVGLHRLNTSCTNMIEFFSYHPLLFRKRRISTIIHYGEVKDYYSSVLAFFFLSDDQNLIFKVTICSLHTKIRK